MHTKKTQRSAFKSLMFALIIGMSAFTANVESLPVFEREQIENIKKNDDKDENEDETMITQKLDQDTQFTTSSGATFTAEKGWLFTQNENLIILQEPERELSVSLLENAEKSAEAAVLSAWQKIQPNFARTVQHTMQEVPEDGWDETVQFIYEVSAHEDRFIFAVARRIDKRWYLILVDGSKAASNRRSAGILLIITSFKVPGMQEESFAHKKAHILNDTRRDEFVNFVEEAQKLCKIPGVAFGIVQNGTLICEQGLGVIQHETNKKVTPKTLFMIGSTTKSLTTFMMARLADEGKFTWETSVTDIMPNFALGDTEMTKELRMKYMVAANTGIPSQDMELLFNYDQATPESHLIGMRNMKPTTGFGETFQYSNDMISAGGYIAAHSAEKNNELGNAYDHVMQSYVFDPIGMLSTTFDFAQVAKADHAIPHGLNLKNEVKSFPITQEKWVTSIRPAGGAWSNIPDLAQYIITELNKGITAEGKQVISELNLLQRREPQIKISDQMSYGLGLFLENYRGTLVVGHNGMTLGFTSLLFFLPEHNVGLVMLTNLRGATVFIDAVRRKFMELLFDAKEQALEMIKTGIEQQEKMFAKNLENISFTPPHTWMKQFLGVYTNPVLGDIKIQAVKDGIELDAKVWRSLLGQKKDAEGTLQLILTDLPFAGIELLPQEHDGEMQLVLRSGQHTYIFDRKKKIRVEE